MKFMGSKRRIAKDILPLILSGRRDGQLYVEAFIGGANSFDKVENPRLGADNNRYLIACLSAVRDGWIPPSVVNEDEYTAIRNNKDAYPPELVGFVGIACAFGGNWFENYARDKQGHNYAAIGRRNALQQAKRLRGATLIHSDYQTLCIPDNAICYLDPPYAGTRLYHSGTFDHATFWKWASDLSNRCRVFVSEYSAPDGWECIWRREQTTSINNKRGKAFKASERLFVPRHQLRRLL